MSYKKNGNSLVMILMVAMVVSLSISVAVTAMLTTTKRNLISKTTDDLLYGAEGGCELAIALVRQNIRYGNSISTTDRTIQSDIDTKAASLRTDKVHSVEVITQDIGSGNKVKIISTAYGYDSAGHRDANNKKTIEKTIAKSPNPSSGLIFQNSIVATGEIKVDVSGSVNMGTTQMTGGGNIALPTPGPGISLPTKKNDVIQSPIFKLENPSDPLSLPKIRKSATNIEADFIAWNGSGTSLLSMAKELNNDGSTIATNGIGKLKIDDKNIGTAVATYYDVIVVNADKLVIKPSATLNESKVIIICSGEIELEVAAAGSTLSRTTLFGSTVKATKPSAISIYNAPANGTTTDDLTAEQMASIDTVLAKYISNWSSSVSPPAPGGGGSVGNWTEVESETIYH